ncbi:hypothetical protein KQI84_02620 [bacterium]|nr:hypothetical protein [bacterium]
MRYFHHSSFKDFTRGRARAALCLLAALSSLILSGCAPTKNESEQILVLFPPPPEIARVQYLGQISSQLDIPKQRGGFASFILGDEPANFPLVKPYTTLLVDTRLYICDTVLNTITVYDLKTGEARLFGGDQGVGKISQPNNITIDRQGRFYIADKVRGAVLVYDADENFLAAFGRPGEVKPVDVAVGDGVLFVCDFPENEIEVWDQENGSLIRTIGELGDQPGQFFMPTQVETDEYGNLCVVDTGNFRVQKLSPTGEPLLVFGGHGQELGRFAWPKGMALDNHGRIYVADSRFANVQIFDPLGRLLLFFGGPGPNRGNIELPAGVSVGPWPKDIPWLNERLEEGFDPESLVIVVNQSGQALINFFAVARDTKEGM